MPQRSDCALVSDRARSCSPILIQDLRSPEPRDLPLDRHRQLVRELVVRGAEDREILGLVPAALAHGFDVMHVEPSSIFAPGSVSIASARVALTPRAECRSGERTPKYETKMNRVIAISAHTPTRERKERVNDCLKKKKPSLTDAAGRNSDWSECRPRAASGGRMWREAEPSTTMSTIGTANHRSPVSPLV